MVTKTKIKKSDLKDWAKEKYFGLETNIMPSFTADLKQLDEDGIRLDIRHAANQGFFCACLCPEIAAMTSEEQKRFLEIAVDEGNKDNILISTSTMFDTFEQEIEFIKYAEEIGCDSLLLCYANNYQPKSIDSLIQVTKDLCAATDLPVHLYPNPKYNTETLHPARYNPAWLKPLAEIDNAVGLKTGIPKIDFVVECFRQVGDKILVQSPAIEQWPILIERYGQQWAGSQPYDSYQSPDDKYAVKYFDLLRAGKVDEAVEIYYKILPLVNLFWNQFQTYFWTGFYNFNLWKYYQWAVGGNGGIIRQPTMRIFDYQMKEVKSALKSVGITPREPDEEFIVGRMNYAKGARIPQSIK